MPSHRRTRSNKRASSLPPLNPPNSPRSPPPNRERVPKTPVVPSVRRRYGLESSAEAKYSNHIQAALASLPPKRASPPAGLRSPFVLRTTAPRGTIHEEEEDGTFIIRRPDPFSPRCPSVYNSRYVDPDLDWQQDLLDVTPIYPRKRPAHKHKRSSSASVSSMLYPRLQTPLPTIPSATPSPSISAAPSPATRPLALAPEVDFGPLVPPPNVPFGWPISSPSSSLLPTPAFSTPGLSPSASSAAGSPYVGLSSDYFTLRTPQTPRTPLTPRPVPE